MAVHDVDQKLLGRLAQEVKYANSALSGALFQVLGLSVLLTKRLQRARRLRRLDPSRDTKSLELYHRIIWMSREGLAITELILPHVDSGQYGITLRIFAAKLRASFYHVFALFHNTPPVTQRPLTSSGYAQQQSLSPNAVAQAATGAQLKVSPPRGAGKDDSHLSVRQRATALRDTIPSMTSEASYITNPYARDSPIPPPPGLINRSTFILPSVDFVPMATVSFKNALEIAVSFLPGSSPLRLTIALEYCAFLWDCVQDHEESRRLASKTIREVYREQAGMDDQEFEDAADLVGTLGRMMRRKSNDPSPRIGAPSPTNPVRAGMTSSQPAQRGSTAHGVSSPAHSPSQTQTQLSPTPFAQAPVLPLQSQTAVSGPDHSQGPRQAHERGEGQGLFMPLSTYQQPSVLATRPPEELESAVLAGRSRDTTTPSPPPPPPPPKTEDDLPRTSYTPPSPPRTATPQRQIPRRPVGSPSGPRSPRGGRPSPVQRINRKPVPPRVSPGRSPENTAGNPSTAGERRTSPIRTSSTPLLSRRSF